MPNIIKPCPECEKDKICEVHAWLKAVNHPWVAGEVQQFFPFVSTQFALVLADKDGLSIAIECGRFKSRS